MPSRSVLEATLILNRPAGDHWPVDPDKEHVPSDVLPEAVGRPPGRFDPATPDRRISSGSFHQEPVGKRTATEPGNLRTQQLDRAVGDPVIVRFNNTILAVINEPNHASVFDGRPDQRMGLQ